MKVQRVDKGYPRATDEVFTGVPLDARNVFLYQGELRPRGWEGGGHPWAAMSLLWAGATSQLWGMAQEQEVPSVQWVPVVGVARAQQGLCARVRSLCP